MAIYRYIKAKPKNPRQRMSRKLSGFLTGIFFLVGCFLLLQVAYPILGWYFLVMPSYTKRLVSPLASNFRMERSPIYPVVVQAAEAIKPSSSDSYKLQTWFSGTKTFSEVAAVPTTYALTIPKLKISVASVQVGGDDLKRSLIAWPTSALPGNYGVNVIFGHSELPQFASPSSYSGIFTQLLDLTNGDLIFVDYDGVRYKYEVVDKKIVSPTDLSVLEQRFDAAYITLITCTPPGTTWMRGVVVGKLTQI